ncbi:unnamed protein product [Ilex paraguariensis]|uniref:NB-ARC domain-containing protein n=1 Tax=Ilex paraguariensis TaxID=185542 RepID=A0ABC8U621_9AQUA
MSKQPDEDSDNRKEIVRRMLTAIGVEEEIIDSADNTPGPAGLLSALRLQLMGKRYLIVLDDAWNSDDFYQQLNSRSTQARNVIENLACSLPKGYGGAVIVTSRSEELVKKMVGEENLHRLPPTDTESCWKIFKDSVQEDGKQFPQYLEELKYEIVSKCSGLPLAAKVLGQIVNENSKTELYWGRR